MLRCSVPHAEDTVQMPRLLKPIWADSGQVEIPARAVPVHHQPPRTAGATTISARTATA